MVYRVLGTAARAIMNRQLRLDPEVLADTPPVDGGYLYVHIPFCTELCPYCSFFRVKYDQDIALNYMEALERELDALLEKGNRFTSVYFGGGTPTVDPAALARLVTKIRSMWPITSVSAETNPDMLVPEILRPLAKAGIDRMSVGVQSFQDPLLDAMNRRERYGSGHEIVERIRECAGIFETLNIDMMFNLPGQSDEDLGADLEVLRGLQPDQVTFYPLMPSTSKRRLVRSEAGKISYGRERRYYKRIARAMADLDYRRSTAWCFDRGAGMVDEYIVQSTEYLGVGAGSFGYRQGVLTANPFSVGDYTAGVADTGVPAKRSRTFGRQQELRYEFLMALFGGGLDPNDFRERLGRDAMVRLAPEMLFFRLTGGLRRRDGIWIPTERGQYYLVVLMREFFTAVNNLREGCAAPTSSSRSGIPLSGSR